HPSVHLIAGNLEREPPGFEWVPVGAVKMTKILDRDRAHLWHPYTQVRTAPVPIPIRHAKGVYLYTEDGRRILDGISSWWVNIHGHSNPRLNKALAAQAQEMEQVIFAGCTHQPAVELAERLIDILPPGLNRVFYSDDGSTAVEVALKMAFQYWRNRGHGKRQHFVAMRYGYHGDTIGTMSVSDDSVFSRPFAPLLFNTARANPPYCYRCPLGLDRATCRIDCLGDLERVLKELNGTVAGVLVEPMLQGAEGMVVWPAEFLSGVHRLCDEYDTLMIADEVFTGFGRTGRMFACEHAGISPDIICLSKALTAGYLPMGATVATEQIYEAFLSDDRTKTFFHGHSYTANPLGCAVGIASLDIFKSDGVLDRIKRLEGHLSERLSPLDSHPNVGNVRVIGGVGIVELVQDKQTKSAGGYLDDVGPVLTEKFLERGLLLRPLGNVLYFVPPYVITDDEADWALDQIESVLASWRWPK
ncbi:MAG TPA: adenosylmethionine--8-amino-7-oxononanoate transaminase, partial [Blastocatellia bacterium]|nr:adenosylmethionine--8-amino-7-oxononanoate transaminase [Blastocatellia bacterium]